MLSHKKKRKRRRLLCGPQSVCHCWPDRLRSYNCVASSGQIVREAWATKAQSLISFSLISWPLVWMWWHMKWWEKESKDCGHGGIFWTLGRISFFLYFFCVRPECPRKCVRPALWIGGQRKFLSFVSLWELASKFMCYAHHREHFSLFSFSSPGLTMLWPLRGGC